MRTHYALEVGCRPCYIIRRSMARRRNKSFMAVRRHGGSTCPPILRKAVLWASAVLAALAATGFLCYAQLLSYLQGTGFRDTLQQELANKAQAESAEISGTLGIDANRVSLREFTLQRPGLLKKLTGSSIHAELNRSALLDKKLHLTRLILEEGSLSLDLDRRGEALPPVRRSPSGFLSRLAPTHAELDQLDCKDFNADIHYGGQLYTLSDSALSATPAPRHSMRGWELRLSNGRLHTPLPLLGDCNLKGATLTLNAKASTLRDARFMLSPGELVIHAVRENANGNWSAELRANSVDIARLIGPDWKKRLGGVLYGRLRADGTDDGLRQAEGTVSLQQGVIEGLPFLSNLPVGNSYPYRSLRLEKATARLSYPHADAARNIRNAWLLDNIDLRAEGGRLRVLGHALVDADGSLAGTLLIGLPDSLAASLAPEDSTLRQRLFNAEGEKGYLWLRLNLSGTLSAPQEDLSVRLMTLISSALPDAASTLRKLLLPPESGQPTDTAPASPQPAAPSPAGLLEKAGNAAGEVLNTGLRSLF